MKKKYLIVGGGVSGLLTAFLLKKKNKLNEVTLIEKNKQCGGVLSSFQYPKGHGAFDYGIHTIYETGVEELDTILNNFLPKNQWIKLSGMKRDFGGTYINGILQDNSAYVDVRNIKLKNVNIYREDFLHNLKNNKISTSPLSAKDLLIKKYGKIITDDLFETILSKLYPFNLNDTHPFITQLLPLSRIVLFDNEDMNKYSKLDNFNDSIAFPNQLEMPSNLISNKSAWYPKKYGMYNFIQAMIVALRKMGITIKNNCQVKDVIMVNGLSRVTINENKKDYIIEDTNQIFWTSGITSAYFALNKNNKEKISFDLPVKTAFVNFGLDTAPRVKKLFYIYCLEKGFITHRLSCPSSFCPASYQDGIHRLTAEIILREDMNITMIEDKVTSELELMGVINKNEIKFVHVEKIAGGYPTISIKNIKAMEYMKSQVLLQYPETFKFLGLMSKPNLFFQTDILKDVYQEICDG